MSVAIDSLSRLGGPPAVQCGCCRTWLFEVQAILLRRLWLDLDEESKGSKVMGHACTHECAIKLEAESRAGAKAHKLNSTVWIDDFLVRHS